MKIHNKNLSNIVNLSKKAIVLTGLTLFLASCGGGGNGSAVGDTTSLPTDFRLDLYCGDMGIANEQCVLDDPNNPFRDSNVTETNKWDLYDQLTSAKAKFYLWATALANNPTGENQFYTALSLQELYTDGGSLNSQDQAKRAYRSVLDNYYDSVTYRNGTDVGAGDYSEAGSGSTLDGAYTLDSSFSKVWQIIAGGGWGAPSAALQIEDLSPGLASKYTNLIFKVKGLPTSDVVIKFSTNASDPQQEVAFDTSVYGEDIGDGWSQITIPLSSNFPDLTSYTHIIIHGGFGKGGTIYLTDIGFTGDETGDGLFKDYDEDGVAYIYRTSTEAYPFPVRNFAGENLIEPASTLDQLYIDSNAANSAVELWGYTYSTDFNVIGNE